MQTHYKPSKVKYVGFLVISLLFVALGIWLVQLDQWLKIAIGWLNITFFGFGSYVFGKLLMNKNAGLWMDDDGISDQSNGLGKILWQDMRALELVKSNGSLLVSIEMSEKRYQEYFSRLGRFKQFIARTNQATGFTKMNISLAGYPNPTALFEQITERCSAANDSSDVSRETSAANDAPDNQLPGES